MELGIIFESEASGSGRSGPGYIHVNLIRAALAEFIGMLLFLFFGERVGKSKRPIMRTVPLQTQQL